MLVASAKKRRNPREHDPDHEEREAEDDGSSPDREDSSASEATSDRESNINDHDVIHTKDVLHGKETLFDDVDPLTGKRKTSAEEIELLGDEQVHI
jgi:hypothetical protein